MHPPHTTLSCEDGTSPHIQVESPSPTRGVLKRAVVLLAKPGEGPGEGRRPSREERLAVAARRRAQAEAAYPAIDAILARSGGRRIGKATVLGTVTVEATEEGLRMLRQAPAVEAVMEDQPVFTVR